MRHGIRPLLVQFPNSERYAVPKTAETLLAKAAVELFTARFLVEPAVIWFAYSEFLRGVFEKSCLTAIGLGKCCDVLPQVVLADLTAPLKLVFVEITTARGAPINEQRKQALLKVAERARFEKRHTFFVTAFADRSTSVFRKLVPEIAWGTFVWFMSEPDKLIAFKEGAQSEIAKLLTLD